MHLKDESVCSNEPDEQMRLLDVASEDWKKKKKRPAVSQRSNGKVRTQPLAPARLDAVHEMDLLHEIGRDF